MARPPDQSELLKKFKGDLNLLMQTANNPQDFKTVSGIITCNIFQQNNS